MYLSVSLAAWKYILKGIKTRSARWPTTFPDVSHGHTLHLQAQDQCNEGRILPAGPLNKWLLIIVLAMAKGEVFYRMTSVSSLVMETRARFPLVFTPCRPTCSNNMCECEYKILPIVGASADHRWPSIKSWKRLISQWACKVKSGLHHSNLTRHKEGEGAFPRRLGPLLKHALKVRRGA
jgi:hypothetical protein